MKHWSPVMLLIVALAATSHDALARGGRHAHHRLHLRPATGIVLVPALVPRYYYHSNSPFWYPGYPPLMAAPAPLTGPNYLLDSSGYAYFCPDSQRYYPDVRECQSSWLAVVPGVPGPPN